MKISFKLFRNPDLDFYLHYLEILMWFLNILKFLFNVTLAKRLSFSLYVKGKKLY